MPETPSNVVDLRPNVATPDPSWRVTFVPPANTTLPTIGKVTYEGVKLADLAQVTTWAAVMRGILFPGTADKIEFTVERE